ncbi:MAG: hypothetical protein RQ899_14550, partial [Pseudomonadales bacterium]|nr:hypothetical protein [Pseudomonadales bacterium]
RRLRIENIYPQIFLKTLKYIVILATTFTLFSGVGIAQDSHNQKTLDEMDFFDLLNFSFQGRNRAYTFEKSVESSDLIIRGYLDYVGPGRVHTFKNVPFAPTLTTSIFRVEATKYIKGSAGKYVFVEYITGGIDPEILNSNKFSGEMLLFLSELIPGKDAMDMDIKNIDKSLALEAKSLYKLTLQTMLFVEDVNNEGDKKIQMPVDGGGVLIDFDPRQFNSIDQIEERINQLR